MKLIVCTHRRDTAECTRAWRNYPRENQQKGFCYHYHQYPPFFNKSDGLYASCSPVSRSIQVKDHKQAAISRVFGTQPEDISINCSCSLRGLVPHQLHFLTDALSTSLKNELIEFNHFHCRSPQAWKNERGKLIFILMPTLTTGFLSIYDSILFWNPSGSLATDIVIMQG